MKKGREVWAEGGVRACSSSREVREIAHIYPFCPRRLFTPTYDPETTYNIFLLGLKYIDHPDV